MVGLGIECGCGGGIGGGGVCFVGFVGVGGLGREFVGLGGYGVFLVCGYDGCWFVFG